MACRFPCLRRMPTAYIVMACRFPCLRRMPTANADGLRPKPGRGGAGKRRDETLRAAGLAIGMLRGIREGRETVGAPT